MDGYAASVFDRQLICFRCFFFSKQNATLTREERERPLKSKLFSMNAFYLSFYSRKPHVQMDWKS